MVLGKDRSMRDHEACRDCVLCRSCLLRDNDHVEDCQDVQEWDMRGDEEKNDD